MKKETNRKEISTCKLQKILKGRYNLKSLIKNQQSINYHMFNHYHIFNYTIYLTQKRFIESLVNGSIQHKCIDFLAKGWISKQKRNQVKISEIRQNKFRYLAINFVQVQLSLRRKKYWRRESVEDSPACHNCREWV